MDKATIDSLHKKVELDIACGMLKRAMVKATVCGYVYTVREQHDKSVAANWRKYARRHTRGTL